MTYERSRDARLEEAQTDARDVYALVYDADRPELFMKDAAMRRTVGPGGSIRVRSDSGWMVPEPELGLVLGDERRAGRGHDRQRRLEPRHRGRESALHPAGQDLCGGLRDRARARRARRLGMRRFDLGCASPTSSGAELFAGETSTARMKRTLRRARRLGDARQPDPARVRAAHRHRARAAGRLHARPGHIVEIEIEGIGVLANTVAA